MEFQEENDGPREYNQPNLDDSDDNDSLLSYYEKQKSQAISITEKYEVQSEKASSTKAQLLMGPGKRATLDIENFKEVQQLNTAQATGFNHYEERIKRMQINKKRSEQRN